MKLHVKWSTASFLAAMAFGSGAAVYTGCTVTSGEIDDFDGGPGTTFDSGTDAGDAGTTTPEAGPIGEVCSGLAEIQSAQLISDSCQQCLETTCCSQLKACYSIPATEGENVDCDLYAECVAPPPQGNDCELDPAVDAGTVECEGCRAAAAPGVPEAFLGIAECAATNCAAECSGQ